jgi:uncharacterized protein YjbI with pentapeptide repeats
MTQRKLNKILDAHEAWLKLRKGEMAVLANRDMSGLDFSGRNLFLANMSRADLHGANLRGTDLQSCNLSGANMREVDAEGASFEKAVLTRACLRRANLRRADFSKASLSGANLSEAYIKDAIWDYADMNFWKADGVVPREELLEALKHWKARTDADFEKLCKGCAADASPDVEEHSEKGLDKPEEDGI